MRKLLALLVLVPTMSFAADTSTPSQTGRYAVSGDVIVDTRTGKAWQASPIQGSGAMKFLIPLSYFSPGDKIPTAESAKKSFPEMLADGTMKLTAEPPH